MQAYITDEQAVQIYNYIKVNFPNTFKEFEKDERTLFSLIIELLVQFHVEM